MNETNEPENPQFNPLEAIAAWVVPGLGHWLLGQRLRGVVVGLTIIALWLGGILVGGVCVMDYRAPQDPSTQRGLSYWYLAQIMVAPSIPVSLYFVHVLDARGTPMPQTPDAPYEPSYGRVNEQGTLYTAMAGLLNVLAIIDVAWCDPAARRGGLKESPA